MSVFFERKEDEKEITIVLKYQALFYILLVCGIILPYTKIDNFAQISISGLIVIFLIVYILSKISINREITKAMKAGSVEVSGSKFSFSNPLTYKIKK